MALGRSGAAIGARHMTPDCQDPAEGCPGGGLFSHTFAPRHSPKDLPSAFRWDAVVETQVRTPQTVFMQPQRLVVPLFQRPYVWNEENQWEPLWNDVVRVAERVLARPLERHQPHFLGAVVLQQIAKQTGHMQERTIIDGQQRLTTLQLLLDALHAELLSVKAHTSAARLEPLVTNGSPSGSKPEDRYKVWPTNRDRSAFNAVMAAPPPVDYEALRADGEQNGRGPPLLRRAGEGMVDSRRRSPSSSAAARPSRRRCASGCRWSSST